jgi:hypothetical protein
MEQCNNFSPFSVGIETGNGILNECMSLLDDEESSHEQVRAGDNDDSLFEDSGLLNAFAKSERDVSDFCTSVRTAADSILTTQWKQPLYKDRMIGVCNMIERQCEDHLTVPTIITHIADWFLFRSGDPLCPLSVKIKMKNLDDIIFNSCFVNCYFEMKLLYELEIQKERKRGQKIFSVYFEDIIESWALVDMTATMVNEEGLFVISVMDLLEFGTSRARLLSVLERLSLHHFEDSYSGGATSWNKICKKDNGCLTKVETKFLDDYRRIIQERGDDEYDEAVSGIDGCLNDNTNRDLLLQLRSVQKLHRDIGKSSKRNYACMNPPSGVIDRNRLLPFTSVQTITDETGTDNDDNNEDIAFTERLNFFLDPAFIKRIKNQTAHKDMVEWDRRYKLMKKAFQRETGAIDY